MKVNVTLDDELMQRVDNYADRNYMSRSGLISLAVTQYLNQQEVILAIKDVSLAIRKIADIEQFEDFERLSKMFLGQM